MNITLVLTNNKLICVNDPVYGSGTLNYVAEAPCEPNYVGTKTAVCGSDGQWGNKQDNCVLQIVQQLFQQSQDLNNNSFPRFLEKLSSATVNLTEQVVDSPGTINAIVQILNNVANVSLSPNISITETSMKNILLTAGVLTTNGSKASWGFLNGNDTSNITATQRISVSSLFLQSLENITSYLTNDSFNIDTPSILLNKATFTNPFMADFDSSVEIDIPSVGRSKFITVVTFASMDNVLPARDKGNSSIYVINGRVVIVQSSGTVDNVSFTFDIINNTLGNAQCVFWNFSLFSGLGGWDNGGCVLVSNNTNVTCNCNHLTSFSILMSPYSKDDIVLDYITYIGVGISMASLVICLIIEAIIWRKIRRNTTSYLRHVSIVNIAVSLLIADIWFIIGAAISDAKTVNQSACTAATFFIHFFYLALFFWMLASALLLFYRTVSVFDGGFVFDGGLSKTSMLAIGFSLGYGGPLIIAVITIAVTAPQKAYIQDAGVCWLNWDKSKALLAFVIPALTIVVINLLILLVVIYKMLRRRVGDSSQAAERHVMVIIARSLAVLTPFFGLTWGLGAGTLADPNNRGISISFALFNSLQGFFILVFGTLSDKKVRSELIGSETSGSGTRSTSAGNSSSVFTFFQKWRRGGITTIKKRPRQKLKC
ncbi:adhesion G-protein coupled receptor F1-like [Micropterus dolomieu]|uniref:adhesion G-protein coupled receptor F1-like n=1 Tax=Micropterus dolomieu TaxID=147949 RepID=UPI001E8E7002|nr:adhesion G-protein coupled receptor F1-like [Micropterus dolomieu]